MFVRLVINALALLAAAAIVPGIHLVSGGGVTAASVLTVAAVALVFGVVNTLVKPILQLLSLPLVVLTLGLFLIVVNAAMLMLTSAISGAFGLDFAVDGWGPAFLGAIVVSIVSMLVGVFPKAD